MNCNEARELKHAYLDGELDVAHSVQLEEHLRGCPACAPANRNLQTLRSTLRSGDFNYSPPPFLRQRIRANLGMEQMPRTFWLAPQFWLRLAGVGTIAVLLALAIVVPMRGPSSTARLAQEITSSHVRSLMASHLTDVASTDQHTVKPWFDGKLDFAPPVVNLAEQGFPLYGGRLDYINNRQVAALVYYRQKHPINLFTWPADDDTSTSEQLATINGYNLVHWRASGMKFWAVSDLNSNELRDFAQLIQAQTIPRAKPL